MGSVIVLIQKHVWKKGHTLAVLPVNLVRKRAAKVPTHSGHKLWTFNFRFSKTSRHRESFFSHTSLINTCKQTVHICTIKNVLHFCKNSVQVKSANFGHHQLIYGHVTVSCDISVWFKSGLWLSHFQSCFLWSHSERNLLVHFILFIIYYFIHFFF